MVGFGDLPTAAGVGGRVGEAQSCGMLGVAEPLTAAAGYRPQRLPGAKIAQLLTAWGWPGDDERFDLVGGLATGFGSRWKRATQRPDGLRPDHPASARPSLTLDKTARAAA